jgi:hypothetical protein
VGARLAIAALALAAASPARAEAPPRRDIHLILVSSEDSVGDLAQRLQDVFIAGSASIAADGVAEITRVRAFDADDLFSLEPADADRPTAWVVVDGAIVHLRAAGAGRTRFVFRDLAVARPLTELDRERVGQALKAALLTVIEGGPGALGRLDARRTAAIGSPASTSASPSSPPTPPAARGPRTSETEALPITAALGGFLEIMRLFGSTVYLPGVVGSLRLTRYRIRPGVWMSLMTYLPHHLATTSTAAGYGSAFRAGVSASLADIPWLELDLGLGIDWARPGTFGGGDDQVPVYRIAGRLGPTLVLGMKVAVTLSLERATKSLMMGFVSNEVTTRPGLTLELWWR